ncbi:MAG TPA: amino acid permease [Verrucomicrobiae bacterium]|nr:amino acid permease [Verrucomicrobiae bacterium]
MTSTEGSVASPAETDPDAAQLARFGYRQELSRVLSLFESFSVAFCYLSPMVGIYSLFALGAGAAGPRYLWLMPIVVLGQLLVALIFAELGSSYPIAGALFQWSKQLLGQGYGWWVGWIYGWALIITVASVDTGFVIYAAPLLHNLFGASINAADPNTILLFTLLLILVQTLFNLAGVSLLGRISRVGVYVEILGTFGIAILLAAVGFHHGLGFLFSTQGTQHLGHNPLGVNFGGNWWLGAALVAVLAHVYIFYGFESAGDVAEEVRGASRQVPRAITSSLLVGGIASFVLVGALLLAIPAGAHQFTAATSLSGGVPYILGANVHVAGIQDLILILVCFAFFSCGTAVQGAGARLAFSYARDGAIPGSRLLRRISRRFKTPVYAILLGALLPALFTLLVHFTPTRPIQVAFVTYPANVNALAALVSFGVSGIYLSFQMVVLAAIVARLRGWRPSGPFQLGRWEWPVLIGALVYGVLMLLNIVVPTGLTSPKGELFNFDWLTLLVMVLICAIGGVYYLVASPQRRSARPDPAAVGPPPVAG